MAVERQKGMREAVAGAGSGGAINRCMALNRSPLPSAAAQARAGGGEEETDGELAGEADEADADSAASRSCSRDIAGNITKNKARTPSD